MLALWAAVLLVKHKILEKSMNKHTNLQHIRIIKFQVSQYWNYEVYVAYEQIYFVKMLTAKLRYILDQFDNDL